MKIQSGAGVTVVGEPIEVVELVRYIGSLKPADGKCNKIMTSDPELEWASR